MSLGNSTVNIWNFVFQAIISSSLGAYNKHNRSRGGYAVRVFFVKFPSTTGKTSAEEKNTLRMAAKCIRIKPECCLYGNSHVRGVRYALHETTRQHNVNCISCLVFPVTPSVINSIYDGTVGYCCWFSSYEKRKKPTLFSKEYIHRSNTHNWCRCHNFSVLSQYFGPYILIMTVLHRRTWQTMLQTRREIKAHAFDENNLQTKRALRSIRVHPKPLWEAEWNK